MNKKLTVTESQMETLRFALYNSWSELSEDEKIDAHKLLQKLDILIEKETGGVRYE